MKESMRNVVVCALFVPALLLAPGSRSEAEAAGRVALVVGNSDYAYAGGLPNAGNDATDVGAALRRLGFAVTTVRNAGRAAFTAALADFMDRSMGADVALVFYAGHGMEMDGVNYLVPVDARLERDTLVRLEAVTLDDVLVSTEGAALRLVILDACRNNPLARSMRRTVRTRSVSNGSFGDPDDAWLEGGETLVAYAAAAQTTADDGEGRNSPYTAALLQHLERPVELLTLFRRVRAEVLSTTDGRQRPHEYQSLLGEHYLAGSSGVATASAGELPATMEMRQEMAFWESIRNSTNPAEFAAYLTRWPSGVFAPLARTREAELRAASAASTGRTHADFTASGGSPGTELAQAAGEQETAFWESIRNSGNSADFDAYLARAAPDAPDEEERAASEGASSAVSTTGRRDREPTDLEWEAAIPRAVRYGRPDQSGEGDLFGGPHHTQWSDDRAYQERCFGRPGQSIVGFHLSIPWFAKSVHWRWNTPTGVPAADRSWRVYVDGIVLGDPGDGEDHSPADNGVVWYQYVPVDRLSSWQREQREERPFVLLVSCQSPSVEEIRVHYH